MPHNIVVEVETTGTMLGRNGKTQVKKVVLTQQTPSNTVYIEGINSRNKLTRGYIRVTCAAMDELCRLWLAARKGDA